MCFSLNWSLTSSDTKMQLIHCTQPSFITFKFSFANKEGLNLGWLKVQLITSKNNLLSTTFFSTVSRYCFGSNSPHPWDSIEIYSNTAAFQLPPGPFGLSKWCNINQKVFWSHFIPQKASRSTTTALPFSSGCKAPQVGFSTRHPLQSPEEH